MQWYHARQLSSSLQTTSLHDEINRNLDPINILEVNIGNKDTSVLFTNPSDIEGLIDAENLNSKGICAICGAKGSGYHYSVYSCEGCKAFFKRTVQNDLIYKCNLIQLCKINKPTIEVNHKRLITF